MRRHDDDGLTVDQEDAIDLEDRAWQAVDDAYWRELRADELQGNDAHEVKSKRLRRQAHATRLHRRLGLEEA